jgi:hypothetical protein
VRVEPGEPSALSLPRRQPLSIPAAWPQIRNFFGTPLVKVLRRWRKVLDSGTEVVHYDVSGVEIHEFSPNGVYFAVGEEVEINVNVSCYQAKSYRTEL